MKEAFRVKRFNGMMSVTIPAMVAKDRDDVAPTKDPSKFVWKVAQGHLLRVVHNIVQRFAEENIQLTLRQLYYQLVAGGHIPNTDSVYQRMSKFLTNARYAGLIDWEAIEDRIRLPTIPNEWDDINGLIKSALWSYRLPRWKDQEYYVELHTEKDALSSILAPIADKWHVPLSINRGYSSASAMYALSKRMAEAISVGKKPVILYLGDHDPSGMDMVRDIKERLREFLTEGDEVFDVEDLEVVHIALTTEQVREYNPPPNPAKLTDSRAAWYIEEYGETCWEVDALDPTVLKTLVNDAIMDYIDLDLYQEIMKKEHEDKKALTEFGAKYEKKKPNPKYDDTFDDEDPNPDFDFDEE